MAMAENIDVACMSDSASNAHDNVEMDDHVAHVCENLGDDVNRVESIFNGLGNYSDDDGYDGNEMSLVDETYGYCCIHAVYSCVYATKRTPKCVREFDEIERAGTEITFRCVECRACVKCKTSGRIEAISIQSEIEQGIIDRSIEVDPVEGVVTAKLPFVVDDPDSRLALNLT